MIVMATNNGDVGIRQAVAALREGKTAVDAIEIGIREVEVHRPDRSVGLHGYPNILGYPQLDALIMDGRTRDVGAVGAVTGYDHPISIARCVMEKLIHVFLVADGAERFASEMGFEKSTYVDPEMPEIYVKHVVEQLGIDDPEELQHTKELWKLSHLAVDPQKAGARPTSSRRTAMATSAWASARAAGDGRTRGAWVIRRSSARAVSPTTATAPRRVRARESWPSGPARPGTW